MNRLSAVAAAIHSTVATERTLLKHIRSSFAENRLRRRLDGNKKNLGTRIRGATNDDEHLLTTAIDGDDRRAMMYRSESAGQRADRLLLQQFDHCRS